MKKWAIVALLIAVVAGCGIEWFPDTTLSNDPNKNLSFSLTEFNQCPIPASSAITSKPIPIFGLVSTASISVSGDASSQYSLDGTNFLKSGSIAPGQNVTLRHTSSTSTVNIGIVTTTLTIAGKSAVWKTATVACPNGTTNF